MERIATVKFVSSEKKFKQSLIIFFILLLNSIEHLLANYYLDHSFRNDSFPIISCVFIVLSSMVCDIEYEFLLTVQRK